jgi:hypothetical protein
MTPLTWEQAGEIFYAAHRTLAPGWRGAAQ